MYGLASGAPHASLVTAFRVQLPSLLVGSAPRCKWRQPSANPGRFSWKFSGARKSSFFVMATASEAVPSPGNPASSPLVQYIVLRRDLGKDLNWPLGSIVAQGCHAAVAACWLFRDTSAVQGYCSPENMPNMRKVVLEVKGEAQLLSLSESLTSAGIDHKLWVEQPENFPTCLATKPYVKEEIQGYFKKCQLAKG